tara:strand:+ start:1601 stop:2065 length:465 start_codon:yes stop_codon:yes gene_type:complete
MTYVKIQGSEVLQFPYSIGLLKKQNPNVGFPRVISEDTLSSYGVKSVVIASIPSYNFRTQNLAQNAAPSLSNGTWTIGWTVSSKTTEEIASYDQDIAKANRSSRNNLLALSDWTQVQDAPVSQSDWATYRQALRNITNHANWPNLDDNDWPTQP